MRNTALLVIAGVAAFAAALRFETAVHPAEVSRAWAAAEFEEARRQLPVLGSLRIHSDAPDIGLRLRRIGVPGGIGTITEVHEVERSLARGSLAAWSAARLERFEDRLAAGDVPAELPPVPNVRPYFRDELGEFECEVVLRQNADVNLVRRALPQATLMGEPVLLSEEESQRWLLIRATIAALLATGGGYFLLRWWRGVPADLEIRLLAMVMPLALLGWSGLGVDAWTVAALVLAGTSRNGAPLLAGCAYLASPVLALQRMGVVFGVAGLLRLRRVPWMVGPVAGRSAWLTATALLVLAIGAQLVTLVQRPTVANVPDNVALEPQAVEADEWHDEDAASGRVIVVGREVFPDARADRAAKRQLARIFDVATRRAKSAEGSDRAQLERIAAAAARDAIEIPPGLARRRSTLDGRPVVWVTSEPGTSSHVFGHSYRVYRAQSDYSLRRGSRFFAFLVFAIGALLRVSRGGLSIRDAFAPVLAFAVGFVFLRQAGLEPLIAVLAVAPFCAGWLFPIGLAATAYFLPIDMAWGAAVLAMGSAAAAPGSPATAGITTTDVSR